MSSRPVSPPGQRVTPGGTTASSRQSSAPNSATAATFISAGQGPQANGSAANGNGNGYSHNPHARDPSTSSRSECASPVEEEEDVAEMTINEIINGKGEFPGLMGLVNAYLNSLNVDLVTKCELRRYLDLIKMRARGEFSLSSGVKYVYVRELIRQATWSLPRRGYATLSLRTRPTRRTAKCRMRSTMIWLWHLTRCELERESR